MRIICMNVIDVGGIAVRDKESRNNLDTLYRRTSVCVHDERSWERIGESNKNNKKKEIAKETLISRRFYWFLLGACVLYYSAGKNRMVLKERLFYKYISDNKDYNWIQ